MFHLAFFVSRGFVPWNTHLLRYSWVVSSVFSKQAYKNSAYVIHERNTKHFHFLLDFLRTRKPLSIQLSPLDGLTHRTSDNQLAQDHKAGDRNEEGP